MEKSLLPESRIKKLKRHFDNRITVGMATCGLSAGAYDVFVALKKAFSEIPVEKVGCIGMCYNEPVVSVAVNGRQRIYANVTKGRIKGLIAAIKKDFAKIYTNGFSDSSPAKENPEDLAENSLTGSELFIASDISELEFYKKQHRLILSNSGIVNPDKLEHYLYFGGYLGLKRALSMKPGEVISEIVESGLRGRGGAGFPTGLKWKFIASAKGKKYLICNGDEGDPGAFMNRTIMESDPFRLLEGMAIGAYATGADEGIIYTRAEYPLAIETLEKAIKDAYKHGFLGKNIMGVDGFNFDVAIKKGAGAFVCGEETALLNSIEGKRGMPRPRPPYPAQKGLYGKPTVINNVGTWCHVAVILKMQAKNYAKLGTKNSKGTKVICLTGDIKRTGVIEVPLGTKIRDIVFEIGGGTKKNKFKAVLSGGPAGGCIPESELDCELDYESLQKIGAIMGSGGMVVIDSSACMVDVARYFMNFTQQESCGKCTPCREGTKRLLELIIRITRGVAKEKDFEKIKQLAEFIKSNSLCGLGQNAPNPVLSTIKYFENEYLAHIQQRKCPAGHCSSLLSYFITENCVGCGNCKRNCPVEAITGNPRERHVIDQEKCIKCGTCFNVCAFKAIIRK